MRFLRSLAHPVSAASTLSLAVIVAGCSSTPSTGTSGTTGSSGQAGTSTGMTGSSGSQASGNSTGSSGTGTTGATGTGSGTASGVQSGNGSGISDASGTASGVSGQSGNASGVSGAVSESGSSGTTGTQSGTTTGTQSGSSGAADGGVADSGGGTGSCAGLALCDDFESDTAGSAPSATLWTAYTGMYSADTITVDSTQHHSGTKSVKIVSGGSDAWGPLLSNTNAFSSLTSAVYGRFWVYLNAALPSSHHAFMTLGLTADEADPTKQVKGIEATCQSPSAPGLLTWNYNDSLLPDVYNYKSQTIPAQTWTCFEFHTDAASGDIEVWLNGTRIDTMSLPNDAGTKWTGTAPPNPLKVYGMGLGWMAFNGVAMTLWFDDVALSTSRIGCN